MQIRRSLPELPGPGMLGWVRIKGVSGRGAVDSETRDCHLRGSHPIGTIATVV